MNQQKRRLFYYFYYLLNGVYVGLLFRITWFGILLVRWIFFTIIMHKHNLIMNIVRCRFLNWRTNTHTTNAIKASNSVCWFDVFLSMCSSLVVGRVLMKHSLDVCYKNADTFSKILNSIVCTVLRMHRRKRKYFINRIKNENKTNN